MIWFAGICLFFMQSNDDNLKEIQAALYLREHYNTHIARVDKGDCDDVIDWESWIERGVLVINEKNAHVIELWPGSEGDVKIDQDFMDHLHQLPYLEQLFFWDNCSFDEKVDYSMDSFKHLKLVTVCLRDTNASDLPQSLVSALNTCNAVCLGVPEEMDVDLRAVGELSRLWSLNGVKIKDEEQLKLLLPLKDQLHFLTIYMDEPTVETMDILRQFTKLRKLGLYAEKMEESLLEKLKEIPSLKKLEIGCPLMTDDWLKHFLDWDALEEIYIERVYNSFFWDGEYKGKITKEGVESFESVSGKKIAGHPFFILDEPEFIRDTVPEQQSPNP